MKSQALDISVRISRVGNREEARLYSDENQEEVCAELIARKGFEVGEITRERNVSGGKAAKDRDVEKLIQRVEAGESAGIVVYDFSRLTREDAFSATMLVGRIHLAGGVVYGVADNYDSSAPMAAVMTALHAEQAHSYLNTMRARSGAGQKKAKERGAYITRTPNGYDRGDGGELVPGRFAPLVPEIFRLKLTGESYAALTRYACAQGLEVTIGGIRKMLSNRAYIGQGTSGPSPVLVDVETFQRVQAMTHKRKPTGAGAKTLCQGLARCSNCDSTLIALNGGSYYCRGMKLGGCDKRGNVSIRVLDQYVSSLFLSAYDGDGPFARAYSDEEGLIETGRMRDEAAFELEEIKSSTSLVSTLGIKGYEEIVSVAAAKLEIAEAAHDDARGSADAMTGMADMIREWDELPLEAKRRFVARGIERINVGTGRVPVERKCQVIFLGGVALGSPDDARPGLALVQERDPLSLDG